MKANPGTEPQVEEVSRVIARALGHNDDQGMEWERYVLAARKLLAEYRLWPKIPTKVQSR
jgi:hypothetical protein